MRAGSVRLRRSDGACDVRGRSPPRDRDAERWRPEELRRSSSKLRPPPCEPPSREPPPSCPLMPTPPWCRSRRRPSRRQHEVRLDERPSAATGPVGRGHRLLADRPHLSERDGVRGGADQDLALQRPHLPGAQVGDLGTRRDGPEPEPGTVRQHGPRAGRGRAAPHQPADRERRVGPGDAGVVGGELGCDGDAVGGLGLGLEGAVLQRVEGGHEELGAGHGEAAEEVAGRVGGADGLRGGAEHRSGVHALVEQERGGACDLVAGDHGSLHGGCAAPGGQHGEVQVDPAEAGHGEDGGAQDVSVGDDGGGVDLELAQVRDELVAARDVGDDGDPGFLRPGAHGARRELAAAARRRVCAGQDGHDLVARGEQGLQRGDCGFGGSGEEKTHRVSVGSAARRRGVAGCARAVSLGTQTL